MEIVVYDGPTDRASYFKKLQEDIDPYFFQVRCPVYCDLCVCILLERLN